MITQRVKLDVNNRQGSTIYARMGEKNLRQIVFILTRKDEESGEDVAVDIPAGAVGQLRILKPSNNFAIIDLVKATLESGSTIFTATLPEQAVTVGGLCYYDVRIEETTSKFIFSVTGHMVVDDSVISSGVLEDVSDVNGLVFPDDFLTIEDAGAVIDDTTTSTESTWSSQKINSEIGDQIEQAIADIPIPEVSDDYVLDSEKKVGTWLGKDLYRNVVLSQGAWGSGTKTLWSLSGAHLVKWEVLIQNPYWSGTWIMPNGDNSGSLKFWAYGDSTNGDALLCDNLGRYAVSKIYAIVYYTKESW